MDERGRLREKGFRPGDPGWEARGIYEYITRPRIVAAVTGKTPDGSRIKDDYKFVDEFPIAKGFEENVEFFTVTYEALRPLRWPTIGRSRPSRQLLWLRAGSQGTPDRKGKSRLRT